MTANDPSTTSNLYQKAAKLFKYLLLYFRIVFDVKEKGSVIIVAVGPFWEMAENNVLATPIYSLNVMVTEVEADRTILSPFTREFRVSTSLLLPYEFFCSQYS